MRNREVARALDERRFGDNESAAVPRARQRDGIAASADAQADMAAEKKDDDVIDADFKEVDGDDDKKKSA